MKRSNADYEMEITGITVSDHRRKPPNMICKAVRIPEDDNRELLKYLIDDKIGFQDWCAKQIQKYLDAKRRKATK